MKHLSDRYPNYTLQNLIYYSKAIDQTSGIHVDGNIWKLGNKVVDLDNVNTRINNKQCTGTSELYAWIIMNDPNIFVQDSGEYGDILKETNAYGQNNYGIDKIKYWRKKIINIKLLDLV